jgi:hypothetical protein
LRALVIDPFKREIRETDIERTLPSLQAAVGGNIEFAVWIDRRDTLYVADFAKWRERFTIGNTRSYSGYGVVVGVNGDGATAPAKVSLDALRGVVRFP